MCDFAGSLRITCQRRRVDNVSSLLKKRYVLVKRSLTLNRQHTLYAEIRQYVTLQEPAKFAPTADDEHCA